MGTDVTTSQHEHRDMKRTYVVTSPKGIGLLSNTISPLKAGLNHDKSWTAMDLFVSVNTDCTECRITTIFTLYNTYLFCLLLLLDRSYLLLTPNRAHFAQ